MRYTAAVVGVLVFAAAITWAIVSALDTTHGSGGGLEWRLGDSQCVRSGGLTEYSGTITNEDDEPHDYRMTAAFESGGVREDSDLAFVDDVQPSETARWRFLARSGPDLKCRVVDVDVR